MEQEEERGRNKHKEAQVPSLGPFKPTRPVFSLVRVQKHSLLRRKKNIFDLPVWYVLGIYTLCLAHL